MSDVTSENDPVDEESDVNEPIGTELTDDGVTVEAEPPEEREETPSQDRVRRVRKSTARSRLYRGETAFDFIGRKRVWFAFSALVIIAGMSGLGFRGLNLSIDFKGGVSWQVAAKNVTVNQATKAVTKAGLTNPTVTILGGKTISVDAKVAGSQSHRDDVENRVAGALAALAHTKANNVSVNFIGPSWGGNISSKAIEALIIFFAAIAAYISIRFEWRMAVAAIVAVIHDLAVTVGVYALVGLQVTPDTVIAVLTILGYSLYDTVVVFDRVEDNAKGIGASGRLTYSDTVNLSMNQVLMRSVNTSLVAILPILSVLILGAQVLGAATLQYFGLALFIGLTSGAYSSIFIAAPLLAVLKERETRYATIRRRLEARGAGHQLLSASDFARLATSKARTSVKERVAQSAGPRRAIEPGSAARGRSGGSSVTGLPSPTSREQEPADQDGSDESPASLASPSLVGARDARGGSQLPPRPRKKKRRR